MYSSHHEALAALPDGQEEDLLQGVVGLRVREEDHVETGMRGGQTASFCSTPADLKERFELSPATGREEGAASAEPDEPGQVLGWEVGENLPEPAQDQGEPGVGGTHQAVVLLQVSQADLPHSAQQQLQLALVPERQEIVRDQGVETF